MKKKKIKKIDLDIKDLYVSFIKNNMKVRYQRGVEYLLPNAYILSWRIYDDIWPGYLILREWVTRK